MHGLTRMVEEHKLPNGETWGYTLKDPEGHITLSLLPGNQVEVNSQFAGEHSTPIYQAIFAWAHNNGKKVIEDESGLSRVAKLRRTSQMFSSALRYGTTRHMEPGPDSGIRGWLPEDMPEATVHNIGLLAAREAELVRERLPQLEGMRMIWIKEASTIQKGESQTIKPQNISRHELLRLIRTLPMESGIALLEEHWQLLLPKEPGNRYGLVGWWGRLQKRRRHSKGSATAEKKKEGI